MFAHGNVSLQLFLVVQIFLRSLCVIFCNRWVFNESYKNYFEDWFLMIGTFHWLYFTQCLTCFFLYQSPSSSLCSVFDSILSKIDEVLSIKASANVFVLWHFNAHHKYWQTYSGGTENSCELCYNFSQISNGLTQMVNFPTQIPDYDSHIPTLLDTFLSSDASICSKMAFSL